jgi:hypothetical protein
MVDSTLALTLVDLAQFKLQDMRRGDADLTAASTLESREKTDRIPPLSRSVECLVNDLQVNEVLDYALSQARHVSEILDVLTAKQIAKFYDDLKESGMMPRLLP